MMRVANLKDVYSAKYKKLSTDGWLPAAAQLSAASAT